MQTINPGQNTGVIISPVRDSDLKVGSINPSVFNTAGDWRQFECDGEWQKDMTISFDTEACMSFTGTNLIATYLNWLMINGYLLAPQMAFLKENGYIGSDGKVMLSPRFTATMSHTTVNGNDFQNVWDSIANDGVVPDSVWPMPTAAINADSAQAWSLYYANVSADAIALGKQFLSFFTIPWEWLVSALHSSNSHSGSKYHLSISLLRYVIPGILLRLSLDADQVPHMAFCSLEWKQA
jgi:hypothetical protein